MRQSHFPALPAQTGKLKPAIPVLAGRNDHRPHSQHVLSKSNSAGYLWGKKKTHLPHFNVALTSLQPFVPDLLYYRSPFGILGSLLECNNFLHLRKLLHLHYHLKAGEYLSKHFSEFDNLTYFVCTVIAFSDESTKLSVQQLARPANVHLGLFIIA